VRGVCHEKDCGNYLGGENNDFTGRRAASALRNSIKHENHNSFENGGSDNKIEPKPNKGGFYGGTRNPRSVWAINVDPCKAAHFAAFPRELARRCIAAGTKAGDTVLDPFFGSGTVGAVASGMGRGYIGIEINPKYIEMAKDRIGRLLEA
jgi:DNA modification methylase